MAGRASAVFALALALRAGRAAAQDVGAGAQSGSAEESPGSDPGHPCTGGPGDGVWVWWDADTVALTLVGKAGASSHAARARAAAAKLLVHDFDFNGAPVATDKVHLKQVAPGVVEITSMAWEVGYWRFLVHDAASYFGLGEEVRRAQPRAYGGEEPVDGHERGKGSSSYKPIHFL